MRSLETDLEEFESFGLQGFRRQSGERRAKALLTEAQGLALPQHRLWEEERVFMSKPDEATMEFQNCSESENSWTIKNK